MLNKKLIMLLAISGGLLLASCGDDTTQEEPATQDVTETEDSDMEEVEEVAQTEIPTEEIGDGEFYIVNESGSSEDTEVVAFYDEELLTPSLGIEGWDMDGSHKTFIYIDGQLVAEEQLSDSQSSVDIPGELYEVGNYTVSAVQYENDTEDSEPIFVRNVPFEIRE